MCFPTVVFLLVVVNGRYEPLDVDLFYDDLVVTNSFAGAAAKHEACTGRQGVVDGMKCSAAPSLNLTIATCVHRRGNTNRMD